MKISKASFFLVLCINAKNVPQNTTTEITTTKPTTALNSTDFADRIQLKEGFNFIAAREAYFNFDGKKNAVMNFKYALVKGVLYAFGGTPNYKQIFKYEGCNWSDWKLVPATLQEDRGFGSSALTMPSGEEALICFDHRSLSTSCELFDGTKSEKLPFHSSFTHSTGGLGLYKNQPATVGCYENKHYKAETLSASGWTALPDHPFDIRSHSLVGLDNGTMLLLGGFAFEVPQSAIWKLDFSDDNLVSQKHKWYLVGLLKQKNYRATAFYDNRSIYFYGGVVAPYHNQRIDLDEDEKIKEVVLLSENVAKFRYPILFPFKTDDRCYDYYMNPRV